MLKIGLIKEGKIPADNRVALTPAQCRWIQAHFSGIKVLVQQSGTRCFTDNEYKRYGIEIVSEVDDCDVLIGIKEVPAALLVPHKIYLFFSHTKKKQLHNQLLFQTIINKKITLIDFECLEHEDGQRIIGFGFFAGIVGAHNGMMAYGKRTGAFSLERVYKQKSLRKLMHTYFGLQIPNIKIAVTGSGRVAHGILEIMNLMGITEVEKEEYVQKEFSYPVYVSLKGSDLYKHKQKITYNREEFHLLPQEYNCIFDQYIPHTDILMNGVYWDKNVPRLFRKEAIGDKDFRIQVIADVTDDTNGSIPINLGDQSIEDPIYGVNKTTFEKTGPYLPHSVDVMAVSNLPNELPRDASRYFGQQLIKYIIPQLLNGSTPMIDRATIVKEGTLTPMFSYLQDYAEGRIEAPL
jgi:alanine dehydrogenase